MVSTAILEEVERALRDGDRIGALTIIGTISTPVLLAYGTRSRAYHRVSVQALAAAIPGARVAAIPRADHDTIVLGRRSFLAPFADFFADRPVRPQ